MYYKLSILLLCTVLIYCSPPIWNSPYTPGKGEIHLPISSFPSDLNIATSYDSASYALLNQIVQPPLSYKVYQGELKLQVNSLLKWDRRQVGDKKIYTFYVDRKKRYHDHPAWKNREKFVTVEDFLFQMARMASEDYACPIKPQLEDGLLFFTELSKRLQNISLTDVFFDDLAGLSFSEDSFTLEVASDFPLEQWMTLPFFAPYPREAEVFYQTQDKAKKWDKYPPGSGEFFVKLFKDGEVIHLSTGQDSLNNYVTDVFYHADSESLSVLHKFESGYFDYISPNVKIVNQIFKDKNFSEYREHWQSKKLILHSLKDPVAFYLGFNMQSPNLEDRVFKNLRSVLYHSLDWEFFCQNILDGMALPSKTFLPKSLMSSEVYDSFSDLYMKDRSLLLPLEKSTPYVLKMLSTKSNSPFATRFKSWLIEELKNLGIDLIIIEMDFADFYHALEKNQHDLFWAGWAADFPDPLNFYMLLYSENSLLKSGGENRVNYENKEFDSYYENYTDDNIIKLEKIILQDKPVIPAFNPRSIVLDHNWVKRPSPVPFVNTSWTNIQVNSEKRHLYINEHNKVPKSWLYLIILLLAVIIIKREYKK